MSRVKMSGRDITTLATLFVMTTLLFADQMIMSAILPELSKEYGARETTLGLIGSAFTLTGAFVSILFGYISDKGSRKTMLVLVIMIGEIPCIMTGIPYFTQSIGAFAALRLLSGIGLGGVYPVSYSVLADYFSEQHRSTAAAWMNTAWSVGTVLGVVLAGFLTNKYGWRISFILIGAPNIPIALFFALYAKEPARGRTEDALEDLIQKGLVYKQKINFRDFRIILRIKTNLYIFLQGIPGTIPWGILTYWAITFFQVYRHVSKEMATTVFLVIGIGSTLGGIFFAYMGEWLYKKSPKYMPMLCGIVVLIGIIPTAILVNLPVANFKLYLVLGFVTGFLIAVATANVPAMIMNVNRPEHRGTVFSVLNITGNLGNGLGPAIGGLLIPFGYLFVMNFAVSWWVLCGILLLAAAKYIIGDRDALHRLLEERAAEMEKGA
ncbi:MAG TPA: MFS transporter [Desulfomonilia bacterium]